MSEKESRKSYLHTYILMIVLVGVFLLQVFILDDNLYQLMTHTTDLVSGVYYTLATSLFLHAGILHLAGNLLGLFLFGRLVERHLGWKIYLIFLVGGIIANGVSGTIAYLLGQEFYSLGASSGIASIIILGILLEPLRITTFLGWFLIGFDVWGIFHPHGTTNHLAHLGGYGALIILYFLIEKSYKQRVINGFLINVALLVVVLLILSLLMFGLEN